MFALVALTLPYLYFSAATIENLSVNEPEKIKEVFFGGEPWVISCYEKDGASRCRRECPPTYTHIPPCAARLWQRPFGLLAGRAWCRA